ncbi:MAG: B12-binding domain-containing radical SAM protein [Alphaproteobacteria bacterium]
MAFSKMKLLLCDIPMAAETKFGRFKHLGSASPPYNILLLGTILRRLGHEVRLTTEDIGLAEVADIAAEFQPAIIGVTFMTMGYPRLGAFTEAMAKSAPEALLIAGGYHASVYPEDVLSRHPRLFAVFRGEAEIGLPKFVESVAMGPPGPAELREIPGLYYRDEAGAIQAAPPAELVEDLDLLPFPDYDLIPDFFRRFRPAVTRHYFRTPQAYYLTGRGCPFSCHFCGRMTLGRTVRQHSADYTIDLIKHGRDKYNIQSIMFADEFFTVNKNKMQQLSDGMHRHGLHTIDWACNGRTNVMDVDYARLLRRAGCRQIGFGIESGSQKVLDLLNKKTTVDEQARALHATRAGGIESYGSFIIGSPGETMETLEETRRFVLDNPLGFIGTCFFTPLPGSYYWTNEAYKDYGTLIDDNLENFNTFSGIPFVPHGLTRDDLVAFQRSLYRQFYMRPTRLVRELRHVTNATSWRFALRIAGGVIRDAFH